MGWDDPVLVLGLGQFCLRWGWVSVSPTVACRVWPPPSTSLFPSHCTAPTAPGASAGPQQLGVGTSAPGLTQLGREERI